MNLTCDVCGEPALGVASSCLGPMSNAYCRECLNNQAEPFWMFVYAFYEIGHDGEGLADWVHELTTFVDGAYLTFTEFAKQEKECDFANRPPEYVPISDDYIYQDDGLEEFWDAEEDDRN